MSRLRYDVQEIMAMRERPHFLARYEDLTRDPATQTELARYAGLAGLGTGTLSRTTAARASRQRELEKHGAAISDKAVGRHEREPAGPALALATYIWRALPEYSRAFGYDLPDGAAGGSADGEPIEWSTVQNMRAPGPDAFDPAFARRRARNVAVRNIGENTPVIDVGCTLPVLKFMLPEGFPYLGVDDTPREQLVVTADWRNGWLPQTGRAGLIAVLGSFEHVPDPAKFLAALRRYDTPVLLSYHASDDMAGVDCAPFGWSNALSREEVEKLFADARFAATKLWAFDGRQSLFRLKPA